MGLLRVIQSTPAVCSCPANRKQPKPFVSQSVTASLLLSDLNSCHVNCKHSILSITYSLLFATSFLLGGLQHAGFSFFQLLQICFKLVFLGLQL